MKTTEEKKRIAIERGTKIRAAIVAATNPFIKEMQEDAPDDESSPQLLGLLIGVRTWIHEFEELERLTLEDLVASGEITLERYRDMTNVSKIVGAIIVKNLDAQT